MLASLAGRITASSLPCGQCHPFAVVMEKELSLATQSVESFLGLHYRCLPNYALSLASETSYHNGQTTEKWPLTLICEAARVHASKKLAEGAPWLVQWLRLHTPNAGSLGSIPPQGTRPHMLQLEVYMPQQKDPIFLN